MRVYAKSAPEASFTVQDLGNGLAEISFYEHAVSSSAEEGSEASWSYDEYRITRPYYDSLPADIEANYDVWLQAAKAEDEKQSPVDEYQLRADVDFLQITQSVAMGISTMSEGSDPDVLEKSKAYYPLRWSKDRLQMLVTMQKLAEEDYYSITGESYPA